ncbi:MAG: TPM domain-containing protein [Gemmatimonadaceae bacterium]
MGLFALAMSLVVAVQDVVLPPPPRGFSQTQADMVVDAANALSADAVARINRIIFDVKAKSGGEIVVVTLPDLAGRDVGDVALRIGRDWKVGVDARIGDRSRNAGVVILIVPKETSSDGRGYISIQTGQGAEGFITDATAGDIRREAIPFLQQRDYSQAMELIALRVAQRYEREFGFQLDTALVPAPMEQVGRSGDSISPLGLLVVLVVLMIIFSAMARASGGRRNGCLQALLVADAISNSRGRGRSHWGGGGFGGGSWGGGGGGGGFGGFGGGGGFSGGGSSGSW